MWGQKPCALCDSKGPALGPLLGPLHPKGTQEELYVHRLCALWSPEVFQTEGGTLRKVLAAVRRGRQVRCSHCGRRGATLGCLLERCPCSFHLACARKAGCTFHCSDYTLACPDHAHLYPQKPEDVGASPFALPGRGQDGGSAGATPLKSPPPGSGDVLSPPTVLPMPKQLSRKRGRHSTAEAYAHMMAAHAAMKRARREIRAARCAAAESSDDEEHFAKKESARLARDKARLNPLTLGGGQAAAAAGPAQFPAAGGTGGATEAAGAVELTALAGCDFSSVAGLDSVVQQLREMVLLPLAYPKLFADMGISPPRGILFYGEPGTGKTLAARALAGACAAHSPVPVTLFARKGADCLGKFSGEAERTLRLLFEEASARAPSIIFLDELDALVPARAARAGGSDQIYASVVSTLLSLMDGISDRGNVVVLGATNRPEAIDPALRRPGRFDREVYFGLPGPEQRAAILAVHTRKWPCPPPPQLLQQVAGLAEGYAGADLQALCTAAVMAAARRAAPALIDLAEQQAAPAAGSAPALPAGLQQQQQEQEKQQGDEEQQRGNGGSGSAELGALPALVPSQPGVAAEEAARGAGQEQEREAALQRLLEGVHVEARDWWEALAAAPAPCSRRHGLSALSAGAARPLAPHLLSLLAPTVASVLRVLHSSALPLPTAASTAAVAACQMGTCRSSDTVPEAGAPSSSKACTATDAFAAVLRQLGAASAPSSSERSPGSQQLCSSLEETGGAGLSTGALAAAPTGAQPEQEGGAVANMAGAYGGSGCWVPCRVLLAGEGERGQEAAAGAALKLLEGCPVHTLSLATAVVEGGGDATAGCVSLVSEALRRASPGLPCVLYLPRLEAWALHQSVLSSEELAEGAGSDAISGGLQPTPAPTRIEAAAAAAAFRQAAASPAFGGHGTPGSRRFPTAPSPFSGLLPLEDRVPNTPSAAHAMRAEAASHRHASAQLMHGEWGPGGASQAAGAALGQQPAPRAAALLAAAVAGAVAAVQPAEPHHHHHQQQQQQQQQEQAEEQGPVDASFGVPADPTSRLPRIRTSISPDRTAEGTCQARLPTTPAAMRHSPHPAAAAAPAPAAAEVAEVEVTTLAEPWSVFETLIKQAPPSQPLLVLATCHAPLASLPPLLLRFFGLGAAAAAQDTARGFVSKASAAQELGLREPRGSSSSSGGAGSGGVVLVPQPSEQEWEAGCEVAGQEAAQCIAAHAAAALLARLEQQQQQTAEQGGTGEAKAIVQQLPSEMGAAGREAAVEAAAPAVDVAGDLSDPKAAAVVASGVPLPPGISRAELDRGLLLLGKTVAFMRALGAKLAADPRCKQACGWVDKGSIPAAGGERQRRAAAAEPTVLVSFEDVARRAQRGGYSTLDDLLADANRTTGAVMAAVCKGRGGHGGGHSHTARRSHDPAAAACCALLDDVEHRSHALRQQLGLTDPAGDGDQLLAAAASHVAAVQQALQAHQERCGAGQGGSQRGRPGVEQPGEQAGQQQGGQQQEDVQQEQQVGRDELVGEAVAAAERGEAGLGLSSQAGQQEEHGQQGGEAMEVDLPSVEVPPEGEPRCEAGDVAARPVVQLQAATTAPPAAAVAAASTLRSLLSSSLPARLAGTLQRQARPTTAAIPALEEALSALLAAGCAACASVVEEAELELPPTEAGLQKLAAECVVAVAAAPS